MTTPTTLHGYLDGMDKSLAEISDVISFMGSVVRARPVYHRVMELVGGMSDRTQAVREMLGVPYIEELDESREAFDR